MENQDKLPRRNWLKQSLALATGTVGTGFKETVAPSFATEKRTRFPALAEHTNLKYFAFIALYFSQGIPEGITLLGIPAWMAINGKSASEIATYGAIVALAFSLKILLAPMMERFTFLPMGRRRPWLLFGQFGIMCSFISLAFVPDPLNNLTLLIAAVVCVHIFVIFQDIATDSLVIDIVPLEQQGKANSFMWGSKTVGTSISLGLGSWLINQYGFSNAILSMSVSICFIMLVPLLLRERQGEKLLPWSSGATSPEAAMLKIDNWGKLFLSFKQVVLLPNTLLLTIVIFMTLATVHYMRTLLPIFTIQELGWNNVSYSQIYSTSNLVGGIIGMITGGILIARFGTRRMFQFSLLLAGLLIVTMVLSKAFWQNKLFVSGFIAVINLILILMQIADLALAMQLCWKRISALQFTFCMTVANLGLSAGAALLGFLRTHFGWQIIFLVFTVMVFGVAVLLQFLKVNTHLQQVDVLEKNYLENEARLLNEVV
jgi:MFS transporter, PAT family, beta-lactamase induction signal transducer AmpG